jgi:hypothetical protein
MGKRKKITPKDYLKTGELKEIIPLFSSFIVLSGIFKLYFFYHAFNLNIIDFIEPTELFFAFIKDFIPFVGIITLTIFIILFYDKGKQNERREKQKRKFINAKKFFKRVKFFYMIPPLSYISPICIIITIVVYFIFPKLFIIYTLGALIFFNIVLYISLDYKRLYYKKYDSFPSATKINLSLIIIAYFCFVYVKNTYNIESIKDNKKYIGTILNIDDNKFTKADSSSYYIGKTNKYIFFYNDRSKACSVYDVNKINQLYIFEK